MRQVQAPSLVGCHRRLDRTPRSHRPLAAAAAAHRQLLLAIEPLNALAVDGVALPLQQDVQSPIAEAATLVRQLVQPSAQDSVIATRPFVTHARPIDADHPARPPLAHLEGRGEIRHSLPSRCGRHH